MPTPPRGQQGGTSRPDRNAFAERLAEPHRERFDRTSRLIEREACIGDALSVGQRARAGFLAPAYQMAFDHERLERCLAGMSLCEHVVDHVEPGLRFQRIVAGEPDLGVGRADRLRGGP